MYVQSRKWNVSGRVEFEA